MFIIKSNGFQVTAEKKAEVENNVGRLAFDFEKVGIDPETLDVTILLSKLEMDKFKVTITIPTDKKVLESSKEATTLKEGLDLTVENLANQVSLLK
ncbi:MULTISPECIES: HPF/RaiA family ribosome-associated protein [unclassified Lactococcus]|uniref:HPF/RaiA family ribosome-associated protein n=1 Tax=unclassified Lactococcus TaxID=2643510 RepID=UPI0011C748C6|nr:MULTISPECIES: HPF/RaiA family ribosome-associated protein [unclassified Lactococcus]MQW23980.1 hypothetical protein [Lactococcus sp. dk101]TXK36922.1 hypothetical protein FVP42_10390 [Lactococcus sp. dk310]TXK47095.1 hypothetical protein FVP43_10550 [Lactococcus sp. dk322]